MLKKIIIILIIAAFIFFIIFLWQNDSEGEAILSPGEDSRLETVFTNLDTPWEIVLLPDGDMFVSERKGTLRTIGENPREMEVPGVREAGEGGLLGLALHPDFSSNKFIYVYFTARNNGGMINRVVRYFFDGKILTDPKTIVDNIPAGSFHNGGRIAFGPDELLYITTGDAGNKNSAQNTNSLAGKILRLRDDGAIPSDNPFGNAVYSYGHRNPQGLAWDEEGGLWSTEHGRSGVLSGYDEINYIEKGANYGWPEIEGDEIKDGMRAPAIHSGPSTTWAPADMAYANGKLYFGGLRGQALYEVAVVSPGVLGDIKENFKNQFGRIRAIFVDPDNNIFLGTSNRDGRGNPDSNDDRILKIQAE